jgi:hypothetical protein
MTVARATELEAKFERAVGVLAKQSSAFATWKPSSTLSVTDQKASTGGGWRVAGRPLRPTGYEPQLNA